MKVVNFVYHVYLWMPQARNVHVMTCKYAHAQLYYKYFTRIEFYPIYERHIYLLMKWHYITKGFFSTIIIPVLMLHNSIVIYHQYLIYTLNLYAFLHLTSIIPVSWPLAKTLPFGQNLQALTGPYISPLSLSLEGTSYIICRVVLLIIVTWLKSKLKYLHFRAILN